MELRLGLTNKGYPINKKYICWNRDYSVEKNWNEPLYRLSVSYCYVCIWDPGKDERKWTEKTPKIRKENPKKGIRIHTKLEIGKSYKNKKKRYQKNFQNIKFFEKLKD